MPIYSNTQQYFKTPAGISHTYKEQLGVTSEGEFYFVIPDDKYFIEAINILKIGTGRPGRSKKSCIFAKTHDELLSKIKTIIDKICETKVEINKYIYYRNAGQYKFFKNRITGAINPCVSNEEWKDCDCFEESRGCIEINYSISLKAGVVTQKEFQDSEGNKSYDYSLTADRELGAYGIRLNQYANYSIKNELKYLRKEYERIPYSEENAAFFCRFFDDICKFNAEIIEKLKSDNLQSIIESNILLIGSGHER